MSKRSALRFQSKEQMPTGMQKLYEQHLQGVKPMRAPLSPPLKVAVGVDHGSPDGDVVVHAVYGHGPDKRGVTTITSVTEQKRSKYGAVVTYVNGIRFDSKREARYYEQLLLRQAAGEVQYFLRQVPIHLPGGTKLVVDFQEFHADGRVRYIDVKGRETPVFRLKKREVEHHYPHIRIELA